MGLIYSASIFAPEHHHGAVIPICRSLPKKLPKGVEALLLPEHPLRWLLAPNSALLKEYKARQAAHAEALAALQALGYSGSGSFFDHLTVCGSFDAAMNTPEPELPPSPEDWYVGEYRAQLSSASAQVKAGLSALTEVTGDCTLVCWERAGEFCHRNLVMVCVERWLPEYCGGRDVAQPEAA